MKTDDLVMNYIKLRDTKAQMKAKYEASVSPIDDLMDKIEAKLLQRFTEEGVESVRTEKGTAYTTVKTSVTVEDRELFRGFIELNNAWDVLDMKCNKPAAVAYFQERGQFPPGVKVSQERAVNVRR